MSSGWGEAEGARAVFSNADTGVREEVWRWQKRLEPNRLTRTENQNSLPGILTET